MTNVLEFRAPAKSKNTPAPGNGEVIGFYLPSEEDLERAKSTAEEAGSFAYLEELRYGDDFMAPADVESQCRTLVLGLLKRFGPVTQKELDLAKSQMEYEGEDVYSYVFVNRIVCLTGSDWRKRQKLEFILSGIWTPDMFYEAKR